MFCFAFVKSLLRCILICTIESILHFLLIICEKYKEKNLKKPTSESTHVTLFKTVQVCRHSLAMLIIEKIKYTKKPYFALMKLVIYGSKCFNHYFWRMCKTFLIGNKQKTKITSHTIRYQCKLFMKSLCKSSSYFYFRVWLPLFYAIYFHL